MSTSFLSYRGTIKVSRYKRGKLIKIREIKNNGTFIFFNMLCNILASHYTRNNLPTYLDLCARNDSASERFPSLLNYTPLLEVAEIPKTNKSPDGNCSITYRATLTGSHLGNAGSNIGNIYFTLRDNNKTNDIPGNVLAYADSGWVINSFTIAIDEVYIIEWKLEFGNYSTTENTQTLKNTNNNTTTTSKKSTRKVTKNA